MAAWYLLSRVMLSSDNDCKTGQHNEHFMEVFGDRKEDMIYLSPDAEEVLEEVDPSKIFIIGGIADVNIKKVSSLPHPLAQRLGQ